MLGSLIIIFEMYIFAIIKVFWAAAISVYQVTRQSWFYFLCSASSRAGHEHGTGSNKIKRHLINMCSSHRTQRAEPEKRISAMLRSERESINNFTGRVGWIKKKKATIFDVSHKQFLEMKERGLLVTLATIKLIRINLIPCVCWV